MAGEYTEEVALKEYTEKAYLNYSMYVILDRALPYIGDGLKPVQRRIIYAMSELGLKVTSKHKKSARTVGDVLGKFHPHGDSACYEAMVLMAQPFSYRYPLVDGQGNWGSQDDPKSFAAMRYTESRMSAFADLLLAELGQGTVEWQPNFDGTLKEPKLLPARLPNVLLNGTTGIAVGMSTDIPSHNSREIAQACIYLLENPTASLDDIFQFIQGPDLPTEAEIITPRRELLELYASGKGTFRMRAVYIEEDGDIIITGLPHQVSGAKVMEQIAQQMQNKKLPMVADLRDESDHENPTRLVIIPRSNRVDIEPLMSHLFSTTDMEKTYRVNMNVIGLDGRPQVKNLLVMLNEWLVFRTETVRRRFQFRLDEVNERLHILEGYLAAYLNIDEVIRIVRTEDDAKLALIKKFTLSEIQADAILSIRLRQLAKLEEIKIRDEQKALEQERDEVVKILSSPARLKKTIIQEIKADAEKFGDARRSPVIERAEAKVLSETSLVASEPMTVILSQKGWVRAAKGHDIDPSSLNYKAGDELLAAAYGRSNEMVVFMDSNGRSYSLPVQGLPSARGQGEPLTGKLNPESGATFQSVLMGVDSQKLLLSSDFGYGFVVKLGELITKNKNGKAVLTVPVGAHALPAVTIVDSQKDWVVAISNEGKMLVFPASELPELNKGKGNKIISIPADRAQAREEFMAYIAVFSPGDVLRIEAGKRKVELTKKDLSHYMMSRGKRGSKLPKAFQSVTKIEIVK